MHKFKEMFMNLDKVSKVKYISILVIVVLAITISLPTLARYKNRIDIENVLNSVNTWDGTIASSYHKGSGTESDPFIISNASEFAYFQKQLQSTNYANTYFKLSNDIIINDGTFSYINPNKITYSLDDTTLYLKGYTSDVYSDESLSSKISSINKFESLTNFKGHFDGDYNTIYGLYMTSDSKTELGLFENLSGIVENLYLENTMIYGGAFTAALASSTSGATIKDVFIEGNVINTKNSGQDVTILNVDDYEVTKGAEYLTDNLVLPTYTKSGIKSIQLKGQYSSSVEDQILVINDTEVTVGTFEIDLGTSQLTEVAIKVNDDIESTISLSNISYEVTYDYGISSGVVAKATSTNLKNIINKSNIYSSYDASGLVGISISSNLDSAYNTGKVTANGIASGLIGSIKNSEEDIVVSRTYNTGELSGTNTNSFINEISNNKVVSISNVFNTVSATNNIASINQSVGFTNVYDVNESNTDGITQTSVSSLKSKSSLVTMGYGEYVDSNDLNSNNSNAWVYEKNSFPILYFDDLNNPVANLHVGTYSWNDIGYELKEIYFSKEMAFSIEAIDELNPIEAYYYIHNEKTPLTKSEIDKITNWTKYENVVSLADEGYVTVYAKIVDSNDNVSYINSEQLILDLSSPDVTLTMNDYTWKDLRSTLTNINISGSTNLKVDYSDKYSEIESCKYYISNVLLSEDELKDLEDWEEYESGISLNSKGTYVVNVRVEDSQGHVSYVNSDYIVFGGYEEVLTLGRNGDISLDEVNITDKSTITYNFKYENETIYEDGYSNNLITNILLPKNTYMTLIDNVNNVVYSYKVKTSNDEFGYEDSCNDESCNKFATYPLSLFTKVGQTNTDNVFDDKNYLENEKKDLTLVMDFSKSEISSVKELKASLEIYDSNKKVILSTLKTTIKKVNVYPNNDAMLVINNKSDVDSIVLNSDSTTTIDFETYLANKSINSNVVHDMSFENKKLALAVKLVDSSSNIVSKKYLKNIKFKLGSNYYSPDNDGIVRIKLSDGLDKFEGSFIIESYAVNSMLETGDYNFVITPYIADDGKYEANMENDSIIIPAITTKTEKVNYGFKVLMNDSNKIIYKKDQTTDLNLKFISINSLSNSNIRMSLYKKKTLSGYDQTYELVDLQDFVINDLSEVQSNIYQVTNNNLNLSFNNSKFDNTGYELRFELYDSDNRITTIKKKFVVK